MEIKTREGWEWVISGDSGFWIKRDQTKKHSHKVPLFCPYEKCSKKITGSIDDEYLLKYGICRTCYVLYVEERKNPLIDVEEYKKRLEERGY